MRAILTILPYAGLVLTTSSTIWGLTHELYIKTANNERRLTTAGRYSIAFALLGLFISLNSAVLKTVKDNQDKGDAEAAEARKKQEDALEKIASQQREESLARQTRDKVDQEARKLSKQQIEGFGRTIADLDRSLHPLFPLRIHSTFIADLRHPLYAAYRERLVKAAPADEESSWPELAESTPLFPDKTRERAAYNLLMAPAQMRVFIAQNAAESPYWHPDLSFKLKNTSSDAPVPVGQTASPRAKIFAEYSFSKKGVVSIAFPTETINASDCFSNGRIVSAVDLKGARMSIEVSPRFKLSWISIELPGSNEIQLKRKNFKQSNDSGHMLYTFLFPKAEERMSKLFVP